MTTLPAGDATSLACRGLIGGDGEPLTASVTWDSPDDGASREALWRSCATVGPGVYRPVPNLAARSDVRVAIVSWNVHVGGGDVPALVDEIRSGRHTDGVPVRDFVLLLQEVFRGGAAVPSTFPAGVTVPDRIEERTPDGDREDIVAVARRLGLAVFYLPSMRNGMETGDRAEDRGNAILSTLPLTDLAGLELPYGRQRRVAISATIGGVNAWGAPWRLRVVSAHLDASTGPARLWLRSAGVRERQASHLGALLEDDFPTVLGSDLNTWAGGAREGAYSVLRRQFPQTPRSDGATFRFGLTLDYLFFRLPSDWTSASRTLSDDFGSDHRPLVGWVRVDGD
jgi:endonuclease/exonuclease/phosphatase family metal-dependent hydrolase